MVTLEEALQIAENQLAWDMYDTVEEYPDYYMFILKKEYWHDDGPGPLFVMKDTGELMGMPEFVMSKRDNNKKDRIRVVKISFDDDDDIDELDAMDEEDWEEKQG